MANLLNSIIANTGIKPFEDKSAQSPEFSYESEGKIKPLANKAKLLPSSFIGSPYEYAKDLKKDIFSIGKAVKGEANDHELGRINDLGIKAGSLGIASYLFYKNPFKLSKTMELVGFGAFFASMSLWPKLAIQMPIKARTGVDFQQEYIDSQGRKKRLYQDPQYVLTDMLPRKDLNRIGKKMGVDENLPDRDNFIKERAHKTAVQANTLWMMTAGIATPIMTALTCNVAEKILKPHLEKSELEKTKEACFSSSIKEEDLKERQEKALKAFQDFIKHNKNNTIDDKMVDTISKQFDYIVANSDVIQVSDDIKEVLTKLSYGEINKELLEKTYGSELIKSLPDSSVKILEKYMDERVSHPAEKIEKIANVLAQSDVKVQIDGEEKTLESIGIRDIKAQLTKNARTRKLGEIEEPLTAFYKYMNKFMGDKMILDKYMSARIGQRSDSFAANQWERFCGKFLNALDLSMDELKTVSQGNSKEAEKIIFSKLEGIVNARDSKAYNELVCDLMKLMDRFEAETTQNGLVNADGMLYNIRRFTVNELAPGVDGDGNHIKPPTSKSHEIFDTAKEHLREYSYFSELGEKFMAKTKPFSKSDEVGSNFKPAAPGTLCNSFVHDAESAVLGEKSSLYRIIMVLDILKQSQGEMLGDKLTKLLKDAHKPYDLETIEHYKKICKEIILRATTTDYIEKFTTQGFELSEDEFKIATQALFDFEGRNAIEDCLDNKEMNIPVKTAKRMKENYKQHISDFMEDVVNWQNNMTPELSRRTATKATFSRDFGRKNNLVGQLTNNTIVKTAKNTYNSKKWMMMFGGAMTVLTGATLAIGATFGRKDKVERQLEAESRKNV